VEGERAQTQVEHRLQRHIMLHCKWHPSALTTELHGQVSHKFKHS